MKKKEVGELLMAMSLQLFADLNVQTTGESGLSAEMKTFYLRCQVSI